MRKMFHRAITLVALVTLAACGSSGTSSDTTSQATTTTEPPVVRTVTGSLTGDLSSVNNVNAVRRSDGVAFEGTLSPGAARVNALNATTANFTLSLQVGFSYTLNIVDANGTIIATMSFATNPAGTGTTSTFHVGATGGPINLGALNVPAGTGAPGGAATIMVPQNNPLADNDTDNDGINDFEDDDDDNDGISDDEDEDNNHDDIPVNLSDSEDDGSGDSNDGPGDSNDGSGDSNDGPGDSNDGSGDSNDGPGDSNDGSGDSNDGSGDSNDDSNDGSNDNHNGGNDNN